MKWLKLGRVLHISDRSEWQVSHAYLPTALKLEDRIRVFLAFRDAESVGRLGWADFDLDDPTVLIGMSDVPALDIGEAGAFDDNGVSPLSVMMNDGQVWLYYAGWQLTPRARYLLLTGLAISDDLGESFRRYTTVPVMERSAAEMLVRSGAFVMKDGQTWKAWYAAGRSLIRADERTVPTYGLAYMESADGMTWPSEGRLLLEPRRPDEYGFGRPWVIKSKGGYEIFYSVRSVSSLYTLGYGTSPDGINWTRRDEETGLDRSEMGWDSEMLAFASIVTTTTGTYLYYNGNDYGRDGLGVARLA